MLIRIHRLYKVFILKINRRIKLIYISVAVKYDNLAAIIRLLASCKARILRISTHTAVEMSVSKPPADIIYDSINIVFPPF